MADVEMSDAPVAKKADGVSVSVKGGDKKKFEVKKVCFSFELHIAGNHKGLTETVERCCALGLGYRCRQLRYLP